jgi:hypothetical protein
MVKSPAAVNWPAMRRRPETSENSHSAYFLIWIASTRPLCWCCCDWFAIAPIWKVGKHQHGLPCRTASSGDRERSSRRFVSPSRSPQRSPPHLARHLLFRTLAYRLQAARAPCRLYAIIFFRFECKLNYTESLRTKVSVAGKRNFQGRDKEAETASKVQGRRCRDKVSLNNPANSGLVSEN